MSEDFDDGQYCEIPWILVHPILKAALFVLSLPIDIDQPGDSVFGPPSSSQP